MPDYTQALNMLRQAGVKPMASHEPMTPGLLEAGNIALETRPVVHNADGSISSVRSMGIEDEDPNSPRYGKEVLVPTVIPGPDGNWMVDEKGDLARKRYYQTGEHLGVFDSPENSDKYAQQLHENYMNGKYGSQYIPAGYTPK